MTHDRWEASGIFEGKGRHQRSGAIVEWAASRAGSVAALLAALRLLQEIRYDGPVEAKGNLLPRVGLQQCILELLFLKALYLEPQYGWGISERVRQISRSGGGSPYASLHSLERRGWIRATWRVSDKKRRTGYARVRARWA